jgi:uncharacterized protein (DUF433 family)
MDPAVSLTVSEASYVLDRPATAINRAVDRGLIEAERHHGGGGGAGPGTLRKVGPAELRYLSLEDELEGDLTPAARRRVYEALRGLPPGERKLRLGRRLLVELGDVDARIAARLRRLAELRALVEPGPDGGEPVLRGTGVPVHAAALAAQGQGAGEILDDYPGLTRAQVEGAVEYARAYPKAGRPYPARGLKRLLGDIGEAMGEDWPEPELAGPRPVP